MPLDHRVIGADIPASRLSRRHLLIGAAAATASMPLTKSVFAQDVPETDTEFPPYGTPVGSPAASVSLDEFRTLCQRLGGIGDDTEIDDESLQQLLDLLPHNEGETGDASASGLQELLAAGEDVDRSALSYTANATATTILSFLFLGEVNGEPLDNRATLYPNLVSYQLLPYATTPAICKGAEYWTAEVDVPDRS